MAKIGIPLRIKDSEVDLFDYIDTIEYEEGRVFTCSKVTKVLKKLLEAPDTPGSVYLLSSNYNNIISQIAASSIVSKVNQRNQGIFWYNIAKNHKLEDNRLDLFLHEQDIDFLIIDGLFSKTNVNNIDKLRELIAVYDYTTIYVVISGSLGCDFFKNLVFLPFNAFVHFLDRPRSKKVCQI